MFYPHNYNNNKQVFITVWKKIRHEYGKYVLISKSHDVKKCFLRQNVCNDVKKYVMTSESTS